MHATRQPLEGTLTRDNDSRLVESELFTDS